MYTPLIIVGAGPIGVELAFKLADLIDGIIEKYLIDMGAGKLTKCKSFNKETSIKSLAKKYQNLFEGNCSNIN